MSRDVVIPRHSPELPEICVATGATTDVQYFQVKLQYTPFWARFLLGAIGMLLFSQKAEIMVPFTPEAHAKWKRSQWIPAVVIIGGVVLGFLLMMAGSSGAAIGLLAMMGSIIGGLVYVFVVTKNAGPQCKSMDDSSITLSIPNDAAADAIDSSGVRSGAPAVF